MTLTTIAFMGVLLSRFVGCHLNAFMVNSHRSLMCGHLVLPCGKSSLLQGNNRTMTCQISRSLRMHSKVRIARQWLDQTCVPLKCTRLCWNAGPTTQSSEQHLRTFFSCLPPFTLMNDVYFCITSMVFMFTLLMWFVFWFLFELFNTPKFYPMT